LSTFLSEINNGKLGIVLKSGSNKYLTVDSIILNLSFNFLRAQ